MANELTNLYTALSLEMAAVARYESHQERTSDPTILALLQGLMRNEDGHQEELTGQIERLGGDLAETANCPGPDLPGLVYEGEQVSGQKTNLAMLRADFAFENEATKTYTTFAGLVEDPKVKSLFMELARAERGHVNGLNQLIKAMEQGQHPVAFFCPVCGWAVDFGTTGETVDESRCKMCGALFVLGVEDGDFTITRK